MASHNHSHSHGGKQHSHGHSHHGNGSGGNSNHHPNGQHNNGGGGNNGGGNNGGGTGGNGGNGGKDKKPGYELPSYLQNFVDRSQGDISKQAANDIDLALHPYLAQIDRAQTDAQQQYQKDVTRTGNIYQGLQNDLAPLDNQYNAAAKDISGNLSDSLGALAKDIPSGGFGQENKAFSDAFGAAGASGLGMLASDAARQAAYQGGAQTQAAAEQASTQSNFLGDYQDALDQLRNRRMDVTEQAPKMVTSRLDELTQNALEGNLSVQQFLQNAKQAAASRKSDRALQQFLMKQIGGQSSGGNGGGGGGGGGNGGGNKNNKGGGNGGNNNNGGNGGNGNGGGPQHQGGRTGHSGPNGPGGSGGGGGGGHQANSSYAAALGSLFSIANNNATYGGLPPAQQKLIRRYIPRFAQQHPKFFGGTRPNASAMKLIRLLQNPGGIGGSVGVGTGHRLGGGAGKLPK